MRIDDLHAQLDTALARYNAGELDEQAYSILVQRYAKQLESETAFMRVKDVLNHLESRQASRQEAVFIYETGYLEFLGQGYFGAHESMLNGVLITLALCLTLAPFISDERVTGMTTLLFAEKRGRDDTVSSKLLVSTAYLLLVNIIVIAGWFFFIWRHYGFASLAARSGNSLPLAAQHVDIPFWLVLVIQFILWVVASAAAAVVIMWLATFGKDKLFSMLVAVVCLTMPLGLRYLGMSIFDYVGLTVFLHGSHWLRNVWVFLFLPFVLFGGLFFFRRRFLKTG
ncbi:MAG TPA: hypothetical protein GXZ89_06440 [Fastidiosipila sp.]|nr:hypothetical protein [Fastidiosipila sp.]